MMMFIAYGMVVEFDRYFVGMSIEDVILSRYRAARTTERSRVDVVTFGTAATD